MTPLVEYIEKVNSTEFPDEVVTVVIPEFVSESIGSCVFAQPDGEFLRFHGLRGHKDVAVIDAPYQIS
ncbi:MAG: hypothetical protein IPK53_03370 [bacterium]|nr:hypothetical protein [bacterium]